MVQTKKSNTKKNTSSRGKKKTKSKLSKGKVYIAPYKIIILCCAIIAFSLTLLLITTIAANTEKSEIENTITQRFEQNEKKQTVPQETKNLKGPYSSAKNPAQNKTDTTAKSTKDNAASAKVQTTEPATVQKPKTENIKPAATEKTVTSTPSVQKQEAQKPKPSTANTQNTQKTPTPQNTAPKAPQKSGFDLPAAKNGAQLIFVFDDGGQNLSHLEKFMDLPFPFTVAVLPQLAHSAESAARVRRSGNEVILHQPMQSVNSKVNPGPGAITPEMTENQIKTILFRNIDEIAPIAGLNNHEGSAITADAEKMAVVLQLAAEQSIYFLDSRTNVETKVPYVAKEMGYSYYERNIFLDNEKTRENTLKELNKGLALANKNGSVIMIGHIWSADYLPALLKEVYPELKAKGYTFSVVSRSKAKKN